MIDEYAKEYLHDDLRRIRTAMVWKLDGLLSEYDVRRPLTVIGTNLLGLVKHLALWEARYLGEVVDTVAGRRRRVPRGLRAGGCRGPATQHPPGRGGAYFVTVVAAVARLFVVAGSGTDEVAPARTRRFPAREAVGVPTTV